MSRPHQPGPNLLHRDATKDRVAPWFPAISDTIDTIATYRTHSEATTGYGSLDGYDLERNFNDLLTQRPSDYTFSPRCYTNSAFFFNFAGTPQGDSDLLARKPTEWDVDGNCTKTIKITDVASYSARDYAFYKEWEKTDFHQATEDAAFATVLALFNWNPSITRFSQYPFQPYAHRVECFVEQEGGESTISEFGIERTGDWLPLYLRSWNSQYPRYSGSKQRVYYNKKLHRHEVFYSTTKLSIEVFLLTPLIPPDGSALACVVDYVYGTPSTNPILNAESLSSRNYFPFWVHYPSYSGSLRVYQTAGIGFDYEYTPSPTQVVWDNTRNGFVVYDPTC